MLLASSPGLRKSDNVNVRVYNMQSNIKFESIIFHNICCVIVDAGP